MNPIINVSTLNRYAKSVLAADEGLQNVVVCGEVTNFVRHYKSGHCYFSLRDSDASIKCVMFSKSARLLDFSPEDGMLVLAYGSVTLYERDGAFQLYVDFMRPYGVGAAQRAFDQLKDKLTKEGLFDAKYKKPLPSMPSCVGVVTSATGAALQDIRNVIERRWPMVTLLVAPVNVQGIEAAGQIVQAVQTLDADGRADVIIVARGGGSREDLWVFNSEKIARAVFACHTPVVSAVGHEIDYTILDYVADLRAPTPSAAAELCVPDKEEFLQKICKITQNIHFNIHSHLGLCYNQLGHLKADQSKRIMQALLLQKQNRLEQLKKEICREAAGKIERCDSTLAAFAAQAQSLSPYRILARGYVLPEKPDGTPVRVDALQKGERVVLTGQHATAECIVERVDVNNNFTEGERHAIQKES